MAAPISATDYDIQDAAGTVSSVAQRWRWTVEGLDDIPGPAMVAFEALVDVLQSAGGQGDDLGELSVAVVAGLRDAAAEHGARTPAVQALGEHHPLVIAAEEVDRLLSLAGRAVAAEIGRPERGEVVRVAVSDGGPHKSEVGRADITMRGLAGDTQAARRHHGRPFQAVCLYSAEVIDALIGQGHPITAGMVGENLTVRGLPWPALRPGMRFSIGATSPAVLEITSWAEPCTKIAAAFTGRDHTRIDHDMHPGWARAYARVVVPDDVVPGARCDLLP